MANTRGSQALPPSFPPSVRFGVHGRPVGPLGGGAWLGEVPHGWPLGSGLGGTPGVVVGVTGTVNSVGQVEVDGDL